MFIWKAAFRFLIEGRSQTLFIAVGIAIGISVLIFLNILITGLQADLVNTTVGDSPHIVVTSREDALQSLFDEERDVRILSRAGGLFDTSRPFNDWQYVLEQLSNSDVLTVVSPVAEGSGFISRGEKTLSIRARGIDPDRADNIYNVRNRLVEGDYVVGKSQVLVGKDLAEELNLSPGDLINLSGLDGGAGAQGAQAGSSNNPTSSSYTVRGIFDLGNQQVNSSWVFISLEGAQSLYQLSDAITALELQLDDVFQADSLARRLEQSYPELSWSSWEEENPDLLSALSSQSISSYVIQAFVLLAVALGISSVLAVSVMQKSRQIGILKALGISTAGVSRIFLIQGALLGLLGSVLGSFLGGFLLWGFFTFTADEAGEPLFPIVFDPGVFLLAIAIATFAGMGAAAIPARRAAGLNTIEVIKNG